jgi:ferritin
MINKNISEQLNEQLNFEFYSAYIYLSMSAHFKNTGLNGFSNWMNVQTEEELVHAMGFYHHLLNRGAKVYLKEIKGPATSWQSPLAAFEDVLKHEMLVSGKINLIAKSAVEENDFATSNFLQWYVTEQIEEEANAAEILNQLKMIGEGGQGIFMLDRELAARKFVMPLIPGGMPVPNAPANP